MTSAITDREAMTIKEIISEIEELLDKATPGIWLVSEPFEDDDGFLTLCIGAGDEDGRERGATFHEEFIATVTDINRTHAELKANAELIVKAKNSLPVLLKILRNKWILNMPTPSQSKVLQFEIGDTVVLKSGGPIMTVIGEALGENNLWCGWFHKETGQYQRENFPIGALTSNDRP